jgi:hypothetical protein
VRRFAAVALLLGACTGRALEPSSASFDLAGVSVDAVGDLAHAPYTCPSSMTHEVAQDVLSGLQGNLALDDDNVYFADHVSSAIDAVPKTGGATSAVVAANTQYVYVAQHQLLWGMDCTGFGPCGNGYELDELDLTSGAMQSFATPDAPFELAVGASTIAAVVGNNQLVLVDRTTGHAKKLPDGHYTAIYDPAVLGGHAFFADGKGGIVRIDLASGAIDTHALGAFALATDGVTLVAAADDNRFHFFDEQLDELSSVPGGSTAVDHMVMDGTAVYWSEASGSADVFVTWRDGSGACVVALPGNGVNGLAVDDQAIYAAVQTDTNPLLRIAK